jgi:hypothetical protein
MDRTETTTDTDPPPLGLIKNLLFLINCSVLYGR